MTSWAHGIPQSFWWQVLLCTTRRSPRPSRLATHVYEMSRTTTIKWQTGYDARSRAQYGAAFTAWINLDPTHNDQVGGRNNWTQTAMTFDEALVM